MSARWKDTPAERRLIPMSANDLDAVMAIEVAAYAFPWTRGNFIDSLAAGYEVQLLSDAADRTLGYFVAMSGVEEMHLLNLTVVPTAQGQGHARFLFDALLERCRALGALELWLEVRDSNEHARSIYRRWGFRQVGTRKRYYPAAHGKREDAVVMSCRVAPAMRSDGNALE